MKLFNKKNKRTSSNYKKYEPKQYEPYGYVKENFKFGIFIFIVGLVVYGVYKLFIE